VSTAAPPDPPTQPTQPDQPDQPTQPDQPLPAAADTGRPEVDALTVVVGVVALGVLIAALHHARIGMFVACGGLVLGALLRLILSPRNAGSLVVRRRRVDVVVLAGLALVLGIFAAITPFPHGQG
jgi:Protein of unknown function (DUF3017)